MHSHFPLPLRLTGRSGSHFTRVARMFAHELAVPVELDVVHDLTSLDPAAYGGHPALKLPALHVEGALLFGTDNICRRLAEIAGRANDPRVVLSHHVTSDLVRSAQELVWHAMAAQVQLVVGLQFAKLPAENIFFTKAKAGMLGALTWLDAHLGQVLAELPLPRDVSVFEVALFCLVEHIVFRPSVSLDSFPKLRSFAAEFASRESAQCTVFRFDPVPAPKETP
ncbi:glutathione S-transferase N-terminal domain-containing protein [Stigmatella hybrida]|uniref:glutathione S-transferase N-terminal domain-containing protein n=1 Tax=Stigmatella hybrida TaxID=394097 RepID=UPI001CDB0A60|nr:glutathione S-transferase N-terminal domain-containing protein [Stigmatella hybrida]